MKFYSGSVKTQNKGKGIDYKGSTARVELWARVYAYHLKPIYHIPQNTVHALLVKSGIVNHQIFSFIWE